MAKLGLVVLSVVGACAYFALVIDNWQIYG